MRALVSLLTLAFFAPVAVGCVSNEYVIPRDELRRLVATPPEVRGQQVHVIQDLGARRTDSIPDEDALAQQQAHPWPQQVAAAPVDDQPPATETRDTDVQIDLQGDIVWAGNDSARAGGERSWRGTPRTAGPTPATGGNWHGHPSGGSWQGRPPSGGTITGGRGVPGGSGGGWHGTPVPTGGGSSGGGGGLASIGNVGGRGGGNGGDAMVVLAVVLVAIAVVMAVGLVSSEGARFDGVAQMSPWQPVHLKQQGGSELVIALGDLTPVAIDGAVEAKVMDDEGYGIRQLHHLPIDRNLSLAFKLDAGSMTFARGGDVHSGFISNMQFGVFVRPWLGLLLTTAVGGAGDQYGATITRHTFGFEAQSLPLALGPLRAGGFFNVGAAAIASTAAGSGPVEWGDAVGGGILAELELTGRLALTLRAGANEAFFADSGARSPAGIITGGIALY